MIFWRSEDTSLFEGDGEEHLLSALAAAGVNRFFPQAWASLRRILPECMPRGETADWHVRELACGEHSFRIGVVASGSERRVVDSLVAGGFSASLFVNGRVETEFSLYLHRLVCTNGMVRKTAAAAKFESATLDGWVAQAKERLPGIIAGHSSGFETFSKAYQVRLGLLRPLLPLVLDYMGAPEPERTMVVEAFAYEPGDTLGHFANALSRSANLVMVSLGVPPEMALQKRDRLQAASMHVVESFLESAQSGRSLVDLAGSWKGLL